MVAESDEGRDETTARSATIPVLVITGPVGAGKTTTAAAISDELERLGVRHAMIDMDHLRWVWPHPRDDPFAAQLGYRNLAAIWQNLREMDLACIVLGDVVESREQVREYERAMPGTFVTVVRLSVPMHELVRRLEGRESAQTIAWYLNRAPELQAIMESEGVGELVIDVGSASGSHAPLDIAREIIARTGLGT